MVFPPLYPTLSLSHTHLGDGAGAVLVAAPNEDLRVVLAMPRGNLEILHPQLLVVRHVCALLAVRDYLAALTLMRKHKVRSTRPINLTSIFRNP